MPRSRVLRLTKWTTIVLGVVAISLLSARAYDAQRGPPIEPWHTFIPHEMSVSELDQTDWASYVRAENAIFDSVKKEVTQKLAPDALVPVNRYFEGSAVYPGRFAQDWNRSYIMEPASAPVGAAVFLHGLTDSPYSLRHIAKHYRDAGYVSVAIRMPGHGTVPAALTQVKWEEWQAATRLAVREARRRIGPNLPLHLVGFSNGGALAVQYALDALDNRQLSRPDQLILISPMIGITRFARFAGLASLPALLPPFAKAAWLSLVPEFNPFKYNSFPVNGARQSYRLTSALRQAVLRAAEDGRLKDMPPILTFQSVMDFTVSTRAIVTDLYAHLPANGSELVLFDINRNTKINLLQRSSSAAMLARILPPPPHRFTTTIVTNADPDRSDVIERVTDAGAVSEWYRPLGLSYPGDVFSLSHVALPFPITDELYGTDPQPPDRFGISLGSIAARGERGALIVSLDSLFRMSSNPFFPYMIERIDALRSPAASAPHLPWTSPPAAEPSGIAAEPEVDDMSNEAP